MSLTGTGCYQANHYADGYAVVEERHLGLALVWDNGLRVVLNRRQAVDLLRELGGFVEWKEWE